MAHSPKNTYVHKSLLNNSMVYVIFDPTSWIAFKFNKKNSLKQHFFRKMWNKNHGKFVLNKICCSALNLLIVTSFASL